MVGTLRYGRIGNSDNGRDAVALGTSHRIKTGSAVQPGFGFDRGNGSRYALVGTGRHLARWIPPGIHRRFEKHALDTSTQPAACGRCTTDRRCKLTVFFPRWEARGLSHGEER